MGEGLFEALRGELLASSSRDFAYTQRVPDKSSSRPSPSHELHQFDLTPEAAQAFVRKCALPAQMPVYEVGPGLGRLTKVLLAAGHAVRAIEMDPERVVYLHQEFPDEVASGALTVIPGDALHDQPMFTEPWAIVANPPFKHSAELLRRWFLQPWPGTAPQRMHLLLQEQTAQKWTGAAGKIRAVVLLPNYGARRR